MTLRRLARVAAVGAWIAGVLAPAASSARQITTSYAYDAQGQVTAVARPNNTLAYQYDAAANRTQLTVTPAGQGLAAASPDSASRDAGETPNGAPVAVPDVVTAHPGETILIAALANDSDPNGDPLTITFVGSNTAASVSLAEDDKQIRFDTPANARPGATITLTYTIWDGRGGTAFSTVRVIVQAA